MGKPEVSSIFVCVRLTRVIVLVARRQHEHDPTMTTLNVYYAKRRAISMTRMTCQRLLKKTSFSNLSLCLMMHDVPCIVRQRLQSDVNRRSMNTLRMRNISKPCEACAARPNSNLRTLLHQIAPLLLFCAHAHAHAQEFDGYTASFKRNCTTRFPSEIKNLYLSDTNAYATNMNFDCYSKHM